ncbi:hypothetical protein ACCO45_006796 [Purpureocillium lilacinum]
MAINTEGAGSANRVQVPQVPVVGDPSADFGAVVRRVPSLCSLSLTMDVGSVEQGSEPRTRQLNRRNSLPASPSRCRRALAPVHAATGPATVRVSTGRQAGTGDTFIISTPANPDAGQASNLALGRPERAPWPVAPHQPGHHGMRPEIRGKYLARKAAAPCASIQRSRHGSPSTLPCLAAFAPALARLRKGGRIPALHCPCGVWSVPIPIPHDVDGLLPQKLSM